MNPEVVINEKVEVVAIYRKNCWYSEMCMPYKMRYAGQEITFTELGLRHPTSKGKRMIHVFDMTDGINDYRLEFDAENLAWMLVALVEGHHARD